MESLTFQIKEGETFIITGASGSGKTILAQILNGGLKPEDGRLCILEGKRVMMVSQQDEFAAAAGLRTTYYGQRYENPNEEGIPTVEDYIRRSVSETTEEHLGNILGDLEIQYLYSRKLLSLSNGERKRVQLAVALLESPDLLILDQPFVGLDVHSRGKLNAILEEQKSKGTTLVLICDLGFIPSTADTILKLGRSVTNRLYSGREYKKIQLEGSKSVFSKEKKLWNGLVAPKSTFQFVVKMKNVNVVLGGEAILRNINWEIKTGERWVLKGHNGAGKTTLLSLINADNPQGYSNDLILFDRQRGSGETIWDIKKRIGFVSPELHLFFMRRKSIYRPSRGTEASYNTLTCIDIVLSGIKDEIGFTTSGLEGEIALAKKWLQMLGMEHVAQTPFLHSSLGEQRIVLLARALIKSPDLLVLDEPCQGLDTIQTNRFTELLDDICEENQVTMIYVTHRVEEIPSCVTHVLELEKGNIRSKGEYLEKLKRI